MQQHYQSNAQPATAYTTQHQQSANPPVHATVTNPQNTSPPEQPSPANDYIDSKITKVNAKNKAMDFSDALVKAYPKDYANVHGCGGKGHAPNSGICLSLCDYSKGTGENSVSVRVNIDVRQIDRLFSAVEAASNHTLGLREQMRGAVEFATANGMTIGWLQSNHQPTLQEVAGLQQILCKGLMAQDPENLSDKVLWSWDMQKNNPYSSACRNINGKEFTPVSTISISYNPARNYAWTIKAANYWAPISRQANGASSHNNREAIEKKEVIFPITTEAFYCALADVMHYINLWEYRMFATVNTMCNERERRAKEKRQQRGT